MTMLTVTGQGQVTFQSDVLDHLGIRPGDKIRLNLLPNGRAELMAEQTQGSWDELQNFFAGKTNGQQFSIEDLNEAVSEAAAAAVEAGSIKG
ncbi:AbrB/MazE/SpoVT family DNA-binding domain-containing protein [Methylobacterium sp. J-030]|uniref:AbrB/MazE/SpoVT family DNA-binding domain-containing protein n=1 Tax=Methylobacterium sp. J-030 TaxID=2836627 RepID=UPI001FBA29D5|nr:AbrB/MazE/SpoVT family DNA-binding domain-containing protein [Methylobacterium sp. J-030]MCJ2071011.1 AbrB/MazE/SpoVT family DNA-binding domain-containing protein [Methylobacterium sp. J-030]